jgi:hypothetical protein
MTKVWFLVGSLLTVVLALSLAILLVLLMSAG